MGLGSRVLPALVENADGESVVLSLFTALEEPHEVLEALGVLKIEVFTIDA